MDFPNLTRLSALLGVLFDPDDEHERWRVYRAALDARCEPDLVLAAVREEPDAALARAVIVEMLPGVPDDRLHEWVEADVAGPADGFVERRASEEVGNSEVLAALGDVGRTRRVRAAARTRLAGQLDVPRGSS